MTYLGKRSEKDDPDQSRNDSNFKGNLVKAIVKQDDILKQSIQTDGYEDTSKYFVQSDTGRLDFIVGGILHVINVKSLYLTLPASRIGKLLRASSLEEVLSLCDKYQTEAQGRPHPVIMFDRNGASFNTILDIYRTGMFHLCDSTCATIRSELENPNWAPPSLFIRKEDLDFWNINELLLEPCCALKYFPDIEVLR